MGFGGAAKRLHPLFFVPSEAPGSGGKGIFISDTRVPLGD